MKWIQDKRGYPDLANFLLDCGHVFRTDLDQIAKMKIVKCVCGKESDLTSWFDKVARYRQDNIRGSGV